MEYLKWCIPADGYISYFRNNPGQTDAAACLKNSMCGMPGSNGKETDIYEKEEKGYLEHKQKWSLFMAC